LDNYDISYIDIEFRTGESITLGHYNILIPYDDVIMRLNNTENYSYYVVLKPYSKYIANYIHEEIGFNIDPEIFEYIMV